MKLTAFEMQISLPVQPEVAYAAWLDSRAHSAMTGGEADCSDRLGESFTAWDGYITGKNLRLEHGQLIIQSWRTMDFEDKDSFSRLELRFQSDGQGCLLTLIHTEIPHGQPDYKQGWEEHYFTPMRAYFG